MHVHMHRHRVPICDNKSMIRPPSKTSPLTLTNEHLLQHTVADKYENEGRKLHHQKANKQKKALYFTISCILLMLVALS